MGIVISKCYGHHEKCRELKAKNRVLEEKIKEVKCAGEKEAHVYEQKVVIFASKEEEWKRERKKHKEEVTKLRKMLKEQEDRMKSLEEVAASRGDKELYQVGTEYLVEHMKEEQARMEEAMEKWKQLYLAIRTELDDLIQRTRQGEGLCWGVKESMIGELHRELETKEETLEALRSRISAMEKEGIKRDREIDILRQSLRILGSTKRNRIRKNSPRSLRMGIGRNMQSATCMGSSNPQ